ncbi:MAG TPA: peptidoglycan-binding protein [Streptosporangiaceae bacterium]|nr:peptidoglycan-binding protein [Streptosporangiaceae bacterium]
MLARQRLLAALAAGAAAAAVAASAVATSAAASTGTGSAVAGSTVTGSTVTASVTAVSAAAGQLQPWPVLKQGRNSLWPRVTVRSLQYLLRAHGARLQVDGHFGAATKAAVVAFQRSRKLAATGVVNARTWRRLVVTVKRGSHGPAVRAVQDQINFRNNKNGHTLAVDGVYGRRTEAAVRAFQKAMSAEVPHFPVDGVVGTRTWQALVTEALSG